MCSRSSQGISEISIVFFFFCHIVAILIHIRVREAPAMDLRGSVGSMELQFPKLALGSTEVSFWGFRSQVRVMEEMSELTRMALERVF